MCGWAVGIKWVPVKQAHSSSRDVRVANFREMKFGMPRSRRHACIDGVGNGEGVSPFPLPSWLGGLGSVVRPKTKLGHIKRRGTPVVEGKLGILWDLYIGLFDHYWTLTGKIAGPAQKRQDSHYQPGHFQVSRVSWGSKGLQLRTRPVSLRDPGHLYIMCCK